MSFPFARPRTAVLLAKSTRISPTERESPEHNPFTEQHGICRELRYLSFVTNLSDFPVRA
jgi:hypothetical protein